MTGREQREHEEQLVEAEEMARRRAEQAGRADRARVVELEAEVKILRATLSGAVELVGVEREDSEAGRRALREGLRVALADVWGALATLQRVGSRLADTLDAAAPPADGAPRLEACPVCGVVPESLRPDGRARTYVGCDVVGCWIAGTGRMIPVDVWNRRAPAPLPVVAAPEPARPIEWAWSIQGSSMTRGPFEDRDEAAVDGADYIRTGRPGGVGQLELGVCRWLRGEDYLPDAADLIERMNEAVDSVADFSDLDPAFELADATEAGRALREVLLAWFSRWVTFGPRWEFSLVETVHVGPVDPEGKAP